MKRDGFIFYNSFWEATKDFPNETFGEIMRAVITYGIEGEVYDLSNPIVKMAFSLIKPQLDANNERYLNGCKGGAPKGNQNARKYPKDEEKQPMVDLENNQKQPKNNQKQPKEKDKDKVKEKDKVKDNVNDNDNEIVVEEVTDLAFQRFIEWQRENTPQLLKLEHPFTSDEYHKLITEYSVDQVKSLCLDMENYKDLTKKYTSANLIFRNWMRRRKENLTSNGKSNYKNQKLADLDAFGQELSTYLMGRGKES